VFLSNNKAESFLQEILGFVGHIKSFSRAHLACGPYVVHFCPKERFTDLGKLNFTMVVWF